MELDLAAVRSFVAVTETRHFGRAAAALGVSISTVTKRLQRLEEHLGVPLLLRDSGGFGELTPAGRRFVQVAPGLLREADSARRVVVGQPAETLRIAVPAGVGVVAPLLPAALATLELALQHAFPDVGVAPVPTTFPQLTPELVGGRVDAVLTFGASADPGVHSTRLSGIHRVGLVSAEHPLARRGAVDVAEFAGYPMLYNPALPDDYMRPFILEDVRPLASARLVPIEATTTAHVAQRILQGREVTVVPLALTGHLPPELRRVALIGVPDSWYHALRRSNDTRPTLSTAIELMGDLTESISRAALA